MMISNKRMAIISMTAAVYAVLTVALLQPLSYGPLQFRAAEALHLLAFFNPIFIPGLTLGVFVANLFSPYGWVDWVFGTGASFIALMLILFTKKHLNNLFVASLWPTVVNALVIPLVFLIYAGDGVHMASFLPFFGSVGFGQFVVMTSGYIIFRILMTTNKPFIEMIENL